MENGKVLENKGVSQPLYLPDGEIKNKASKSEVLWLRPKQWSQMT